MSNYRENQGAKQGSLRGVALKRCELAVSEALGVKARQSTMINTPMIRCPLLAQSGHFASALHMSAFGGKADMARFYSTFGKSGTQYESASNTRAPI